MKTSVIYFEDERLIQMYPSILCSENFKEILKKCDKCNGSGCDKCKGWGEIPEIVKYTDSQIEVIGVKK